MSYVGTGRGRYMQTTEIKYVGQGGDLDVIPVARPGPRVCLWFLPLLCLIPLLLLLLQPGTTTTTPPPPPPVVVTLPPPPPTTTTTRPPPPPPPPTTTTLPGGTCTVWGDPHVMTFDNVHLDFYSPGEYWIVKSDTVKIQGKYLPTKMTHGLSVTKEIGVSGSFIKNHKLIIGARTATWDGVPILEGFPSQWSNNDAGVTAVYDNQGKVLQKSRVGKALHVIHLELPNSVKMQINRWTEPTEGDYVNTRITMPPIPGMDGHCGNFNGNDVDDDRLQIRARLGKTGVPEDELIFPGPKTPVVESDRPDINDCPQDELEAAEKLCKQSENSFFPSKACLVDVCFGGKGFAQV